MHPLAIKLVKNTIKNLVKYIDEELSTFQFKNINTTYHILFHDDNSFRGRFEPLLCKREMNTLVGPIQKVKDETYKETLQGKQLVAEVFMEPPQKEKNSFLFIVEVASGGGQSKVFAKVF